MTLDLRKRSSDYPTGNFMFEYTKHCKCYRLQKLQSTFALLMAIGKKPLQKRNLISLAKKFKFTEIQAAEIAGVSIKTYKKMELSSTLSTSASERIVKMSELYETGLTTFDGDAKSFLHWLNTSIPALMNFVPIDLMTTFIGINFVREELLRMEYSIPR